MSLVFELFEVDLPSMWIKFQLLIDVINNSLFLITQFFPFLEGFEVIDVLFYAFFCSTDIELVEVILDLGFSKLLDIINELLDGNHY